MPAYKPPPVVMDCSMRSKALFSGKNSEVSLIICMELRKGIFELVSRLRVWVKVEICIRRIKPPRMGMRSNPCCQRLRISDFLRANRRAINRASRAKAMSPP